MENQQPIKEQIQLDFFKPNLVATILKAEIVLLFYQLDRHKKSYLLLLLQ
jgi:hypothetical protein